MKYDYYFYFTDREPKVLKSAYNSTVNEWLFENSHAIKPRQCGCRLYLNHNSIWAEILHKINFTNLHKILHKNKL